MDITEQLKRDEGLSLTAYEDTVGKITIGYGRNISDVGISQAEADIMLGNDIDTARKNLVQAFPWTDKLDEARLGAFVNLTFNMGIANLRGFVNMMALAKQGMWHEAAQHLLQSRYAAQVGDRAKRLAKQLETGVWI